LRRFFNRFVTAIGVARRGTYCTTDPIRDPIIDAVNRVVAPV
jgi:hypothetical protein